MINWIALTRDMCSLRTRNGLRRCRPATPPVGSLTPGMPRRYRRCPRFGFVQNVPYTAGEPVAAPEGKSKRKSSGAPSVGNASRSSDGRSEETSDKRYASVEHKLLPSAKRRMSTGANVQGWLTWSVVPTCCNNARGGLQESSWFQQLKWQQFPMQDQTWTLD